MRRFVVRVLVLLSIQLEAQAVISINTAVARVGSLVNDNVNVTSASFTPPANSLVLVIASLDAMTDVNATALVTDSRGLTWVPIAESDVGHGTTQSGHTSAWYAKSVTSASMTVSVQRNTNTGTTHVVDFKVYVITGHDLNQPIGAVAYGDTTTNAYTANAYTSTVNNSRGFAAMTDWAALGAPSSTDVEDAAHYAGAISVQSMYKASDTATSGTAVAFDMDAFGSSAPSTTWVAFEVRPAPTGVCSTPAGVTGQFQWVTASSNVKYCDGSNWIDATHATGASCLGTTAGTIDYLSGDFRYCNGSNWISMKGSYDSSCTGTTAGTAGFTSNYFRYCDGTNWYQLKPSVIEFKKHKENSATVNSNNIATGNFTGSVGEKNLILCWIEYNSITRTVSSLTDTKGNTYSSAAAVVTGTGSISSWRQEIWYAAGVTGGTSFSVTATFSGTFNTFKSIACFEYSGAALTNPIDQSTTSAAGTVNATSSSITTTTPNQIIFGATAFASSGRNGVGNIIRTLFNGNVVQEKSAPTAGSYNSNFTNTAQDWMMTVVSIKPQ